jgi:hypothetical protein
MFFFFVDWNVVVDMFEDHLTKLRSDSRYKNALIYVYIEANMSYIDANEVRKVLEQPQFYPVIVKSFDPTTEERAGVWTGPPEKQLYAMELKRALSDALLVYADNLITNDPGVKTEIKNQLEVFRRDVKITPQGKRTIEYTGKSSNRKDDMCLVLQMMLYWSNEMRESHEYIKASETNGWRL